MTLVYIVPDFDTIRSTENFRKPNGIGLQADYIFQSIEDGLKCIKSRTNAFRPDMLYHSSYVTAKLEKLEQEQREATSEEVFINLHRGLTNLSDV